MAITKIWSVSSRLDLSVGYITNPEKTSVKLDVDAVEGLEKYIENPDKTENAIYVRGYNCTKGNAYKQMLKTQEKEGKSHRIDGVLAYHLVQSFKDFETTPEVAFKCGQELVERIFADRFQVVVATHLDHEHLHNHIIFNAVSFKDGYKYRNNYKDYFHDIRGISDQICIENCLSTIENPKRRGMHYGEWLALKEGRPTIRGQVRNEIDQIILSSYTMKEFWKIFQERGNRIHRQGENITHTSFIPACGKKPIRFSNLGEGYSLEDIQKRITAQRNGIRTAAPSELPKRKVYKFNGDIRNVKPKKLKGFVALYFHYMYFFKLIRKNRTPQRVSYFMRDELIKLDRYQKQFKFLYKNNIETGTQLSEFQKSREDKINELVEKRKLLYASKNEENEQEVKAKASEINAELRALRVEVRMCKNIAIDSYRISEKYKQAQELQKQAEREMMANEHKRRGR